MLLKKFLVCKEQPVMECETEEVCEYVLKEKSEFKTEDKYEKVCFMVETDCKQKQECTTKKVSIQEPVIEQITHNGLSMETRVAEMEKMIWELNEQNQELKFELCKKDSTYAWCS